MRPWLLPTSLSFSLLFAAAALDAAEGAVAGGANLAPAAAPSASYTSGDTRTAVLCDGHAPERSDDARHGTYGNWPKTDTQWVEYTWSRPVSVTSTEVYWWADGRGVGAPKSARLLRWDGAAYVPVDGGAVGVERDRFNRSSFGEVTTDKLRLEITSDGKLSTGVIEWRVFDSGRSPAFPPKVRAGVDRTVVLGGKTFLDGEVQTVGSSRGSSLLWRKVSGPGEVAFADATAASTTATFTTTGDYALELVARAGDLENASAVRVRVAEPPPAQRLDVVYTKRYRIDSPLWGPRAKALIVNWIPHCIAQIERSDLPTGQGGIDNFVEAGKALRGEPHAKHRGYVFSNAWVHQTVESICIALMVDPAGDAEIAQAQEKMRATLEDWIPKILSAQEPDGYLHTAYTLAARKDWPERWMPEHRADHEGYTAGYFIESAINHHTLTEGRDLRLYDAAKKLADCWVANIGPGRKVWFDGHQEMEQALVRFGRFVNDVEGGGKGDAYTSLARFLLDSRAEGDEYDQSHVPVTRQYEAVGHAVRATYSYSGMADVAAQTGDRDYESAVLSLWDNLVNRKYYVTGGIGSGETSEGFGPDFSLPHGAYCESCSSAGLIFFQYKLNLAYHDARYADLYEETLYNALLGSIDLPGKNFTYTNPLVGGGRGPWHPCPCCVGNIPRTLLMIPTWTYVKSAEGLYANLFIGGSVRVDGVAGTDVEITQKTDYPWDGHVLFTLNPKEPRTFTFFVRIPNRDTSELYTETPAVYGYEGIRVNREKARPEIVNGYAVLRREWKAGDTVELELPMTPQRITADPRIAATRGQVALRRGPLVYAVEGVDQPRINGALGATPVEAVWHPELLEGVVTLSGTWADGSPLVAIPYYARLNRAVPVAPGEATPGVNYAPGTNQPAAETAPKPDPKRKRAAVPTQVWLKAVDGK